MAASEPIMSTYSIDSNLINALNLNDICLIFYTTNTGEESCEGFCWDGNDTFQVISSSFFITVRYNQEMGLIIRHINNIAPQYVAFISNPNNN